MKKTGFLSILLVIILLLSSCDFNAPLRNKMVDYYSENINYIELYGVIVSINIIESTQENILEIDILTENHSFPINTETGYGEFVIVSYDQYDFDLEANDEIIFNSAPMYFYNGHYLPITSLEKSGEILLTFCEGKESYLMWIKKSFN